MRSLCMFSFLFSSIDLFNDIKSTLSLPVAYSVILRTHYRFCKKWATMFYIMQR